MGDHKKRVDRLWRELRECEGRSTSKERAACTQLAALLLANDDHEKAKDLYLRAIALGFVVDNSCMGMCR